MAVDSCNMLSNCTLFVRGIPCSWSNDTLSEVFSKAGAVKRCFIVKCKDSIITDRPLNGYVTYMTHEEAKSALGMEKELSFDNAKIKVSLARRKSTERKVGPAKEGDADATENSNNYIQYKKTAGNFTVRVNGLPALYKKEHVLSLWKKSGFEDPVRLIFPCEDVNTNLAGADDGVVSDKDKRYSAEFSVASKQDALKAFRAFSGKLVGKKRNYKLKAVLHTPEDNFRAAKKSRIIVRNVSFQCSEEDLKKVFSSYGTVTETTIPLKPDGKKRGFAFVQFSRVSEAAKAIQEMNMQDIKGRKVAIDWSVPKKQYQEMTSAPGNSEPGSEVSNKDEPASAKDSDAGEDLSPNEISSEDDDDDGVDEDGKDDAASELSDLEEDSDMEEDEGIGSDSSPKKTAKSKKKHDSMTSHDVHEQKTLYIQNVPFEASEESLLETFLIYGKVRYAKIVLNKDTGMSKGCGFVQFNTAAEASNCLNALTEQQKKLMLHGKELRVFLAVNRNDANRLNQNQGIKEKVDKRNLHLGREGLVRPGTQAAEGLSEIELRKREKIENAKRLKLRSPDVFFSTTRLCVHNLPRSVDSKALTNLLMSQFQDRRGVKITECRIMRNMKVLNEKGQGRPLGYAFVNFTQHEHALKALRCFNNNPDVFGPIKRPIVEFSLENRKALEIKERRKQKFHAKQKLKKELAASENDSNSVSFKKDYTLRKNDMRFNISTNQERRRNAFHASKTQQLSADARLPFQGCVGTSASGKKLPMPNHTRPKIRSRNKGKIIEQLRRSKKLNAVGSARRKVLGKSRENLRGHLRNETHNKSDGRKRKRETKDFDDHVSKYAKILLSHKGGQKWYE